MGGSKVKDGERGTAEVILLNEWKHTKKPGTHGEKRGEVPAWQVNPTKLNGVGITEKWGNEIYEVSGEFGGERRVPPAKSKLFQRGLFCVLTREEAQWKGIIKGGRAEEQRKVQARG